MPIETYILIMLYSGIAVVGLNYVKHIRKVNEFYGRLQDLFNAYYTQYPAQHPEYFEGIVCFKRDAYLRFWESDFNNFILEPTMLQELYKGADIYNKKKAQEQRNNMQMACAWCENEDVEKFLYFETVPEEHKGTIQCQECLSTCPIGTYDECVKLMQPITEEEIQNENL